MLSTDQNIKTVVDRLVEIYQPVAIYLFGSRARGDAGKDSDYDFFIVVPDDADKEQRRGGAAYEALAGTGIAADFLIEVYSMFNALKSRRATIHGKVSREGQLLYES